jgi:serine/threonine protein phosphatase PrpC
MSAPSTRPSPFAPGTLLSEHYVVEGLVRLAEGRMFYLAHNDRPDRARRFCWDCGNDDSPQTAERCVACGASMAARRFLISVRWDADGFQAYADYFEKRIHHPGFSAPVDMFFQDGVLCSVVLWDGEGLLLDEASPLTPVQLLDMAQRTTGIFAYLHQSGVCLSRLGPANFLISEAGRVTLYDPDVQEVHPGPVPAEDRGADVVLLGRLLLRLTPPGAGALLELFEAATDGRFGSAQDLGQALIPVIERGVPPLRTSAAAMTDVGLVRALNEDNWGWTRLSDDIVLHVVADGMGGHDSGEVASAMAVATICREAAARVQATADRSRPRLEAILEESFQAANNGIKQHSERMQNDMGTTMVAAMVIDHKLALLANVGDSRGYLLRDELLHQVTRDHSLVARWVEQGRVSPEEARSHPMSNILLLTVGTEMNVNIDIFSIELQPGDKLILCSDGLWGEVEDAEIEDCLNRYPDMRQACRELIRAAHHGGGRDNVTLLIYEAPPAA